MHDQQPRFQPSAAEGDGGAGADVIVFAGHLDLGGILRGRPLAFARLAELMAVGVGWVPVNQAISPLDGIPADTPFGAIGDLRLVPDADALFLAHTAGPDRPPLALALGGLVELDGSPSPLCPRHLLKTAAARLLERHGFTLKVAFEQEFTLRDGPPTPGFSLARQRAEAVLVERWHAALEEAGVALAMLLPEFGAGQFEFSLVPAEPVRAADLAVAGREIIRDAARQLGRRVTFSPAPAAGGIGNGVHVHISLADADGRPVGHDPAAPGGLSARFAAFLAGVAEALPAITYLLAPSPVSYFRLQPHRWSAAGACIGLRNREAALRICPVHGLGGAAPAAQFNVELRVPDATANFYLLLAAIIEAGFAGLAKGRPPQTIVEDDVSALTPEQRVALGIRPLPASLADARACFLASRWAQGLLPEPMLRCFDAMKRHEIKQADGWDEDELVRRYAEVF